VTNLPRMARILLVDDNAMDVELALDAFNEVRLSNQIDVARSGQEALDRLFGRHQRLANQTLTRLSRVCVDLPLDQIAHLVLVARGRLDRIPPMRRHVSLQTTSAATRPGPPAG